MRKTTFLFPAAVLATAAMASAVEVTRTPNVSGFTKVEARRAFEVEIRRGETFHVEVRVDDRLANDLDVHTVGDRLVLDLKTSHWSSHWTWRDNGRVVAVVTMPKLRGFEGSGATRTQITGFRSTDSIDINLSGASRLEASIEAGDTRLELSGASKADLAGRGGALHLHASGASHLDLDDFLVASADVNLSGASNARINTSGRLDVDASGASHLSHKGHPRMGDIRSSGASSVRSRD